MTNLTELTEKYLKYCKEQRILDNKTIKAYEIDLNQFCTYFCTTSNVLSLLQSSRTKT